MPRLSDSMEEGTIMQWLIPAGGMVTRGQELVEIETDKATIAHVAEGDGVLEIIAQDGTTLPVGTPIARLLPAETADGAGEDRGERNGLASAGRAPSPVPEPAPQPVTVEPLARPTDSLTQGDTELSDPTISARRVRAPATPLARRIARLHGVDIAELAGTGPGGRVTRSDVLLAAGLPPPAPDLAGSAAFQPSPESEQSSADSAAGAKGKHLVVSPSRAQQVTGRRMAESKATIPHFQVETEVLMDAAKALRDALKAGGGHQPVPSLTDLALKAAALALRQHPPANASYVDGRFELYGRINIGFAVAAEDALVVPVVLDADTKSLGSIARETRRLAERVRARTITPPELSGATFTISNLGMYGVTALNPVINPPQAAILGVGALRQTLAREEGSIVDRTLMTLTLSCDHRILDGVAAAGLLGTVRLLLEQPARLAL